MVTIERGIPVPKSKMIYPWADMAVGDSFLFPDFVQFPYETARAYSHRHKEQFTTRKTREGYRCWRIA